MAEKISVAVSIVPETGLESTLDALIKTLHAMNESANGFINGIRQQRFRYVHRHRCKLRTEEVAILLRRKDIENSATWESFFAVCGPAIGKLQALLLAFFFFLIL